MEQPGCELLSKLFIFVTRHNHTTWRYILVSVVNCFQNCLSSWHDTTDNSVGMILTSLWIAFKIVYLRDTTQQFGSIGESDGGCELLSKLFIFVTRHNVASAFYHLLHVVNCFQNCLSSWHDTTLRDTVYNNPKLWIAFKIVYLRDTTQHFWILYNYRRCCELLSKLFIFVTRHNECRLIGILVLVVNCFQNCLSSWHDTTCSKVFRERKLLWIAFKIVYLRDTTQPGETTIRKRWSCELLSKLFIFVTRHNIREKDGRQFGVVNCFQNCLSSWHDTTKPYPQPQRQELWIAFKIVYLRDTTQHFGFNCYFQPSCELLSKLFIFVTRHNFVWVLNSDILVVNCFQNCLSSWHDTTVTNGNTIGNLLWIAFKIVYLRDTTQQFCKIVRNIQSCELLSKLFIFVTRHNTAEFFNFLPCVVNCFQNCLSSWHDTTEISGIK